MAYKKKMFVNILKRLQKYYLVIKQRLNGIQWNIFQDSFLNYSMNKKLLEKDKKYTTKEGGLGYVGLQARRQSIVFEKKKKRRHVV